MLTVNLSRSAFANPPQLSTHMFIVFEGIDGTGKSTQVKMLAEALRERGLTVQQSFEPTNGQFGALLRASMTRPEGRYPLNEELDLFYKDRKEHVETLINPALEREEVVILDRYYYSMMAYQGARGVNTQEIRERNEAFATTPDLIIVLTVPIEVSLDRIGVRDGEGNAFEKRENLEKCADIFASLEDDNLFFIDATRSPEEIHEEIRRLTLGYML